MVVSKDKRKRKTPPPQPSAVESSPEMPKRTKVQAQRKFAQGQSAPTSSYNSLIAAASSSSNTGPSTSSESREPPTEILPNKRPKTEDFLTFLCFRGTTALPAHLDFLNQGKSKEPDVPVKKKNITKTIKQAKPAKKGKKGRPKGSTKNAEQKASTSTSNNDVKPLEDDETKSTTKAASTGGSKVSKDNAISADKVVEDNTTLNAVRKRADVVVSEGNRRGRTVDRQLRNTSDVDKCNNSPDLKRRSNRTNKEKAAEEEEYLSPSDEVEKADSSGKNISTSATKNDRKTKKSLTTVERNIETPSNESETGRSRKGKTRAVTPKNQKTSLKEDSVEANKLEQQPIKEKTAMKRPRQKESPIFIPSPEPSGRMTRQRAFFEPVKVPQRSQVEEEEEEETAAAASVNEANVVDTSIKSDIKNEDAHNEKDNSLQHDDDTDNNTENVQALKAKPNMNVFDFSSDDEQPLAKAIKVKKGKGPVRKATGRVGRGGRRSSPKKGLEINEEPKPTSKEIANNEQQRVVDKAPEKVAVTEEKFEEEESPNKSVIKGKRGRQNIKQNKTNENTFEKEDEKEATVQKLPAVVTTTTSAPSSPKKGKKAKVKTENQTVNGEDATAESSPDAPLRNQRPSRKTKEAATIYMGIIGHKLRLPDDEDDDSSLNSFPNLPNVKEMEKMEIELKKNAAAQSNAATSPTAMNKISPKLTTNTANTTELPTVASAGDKPMAGRRGRPPKLGKLPPVRREIEGMLVKKGAIAKITSSAHDAAAALQNREKSTEPVKVLVESDDDEDFLLNEEVNETKRKLEKSFSDSDDEPLAIKVNIKSNDRDDKEHDSKKSDGIPPQNSGATLTMLPLTATPTTKTVPTVATLPVTLPTNEPVQPPPPAAPQQQQQHQHQQQTQPSSQNIASSQAISPFKIVEKKSPVPTSKILNVPATYATPGSSIPINATFNKTTSYLPQASPHYHTPHAAIRPPHLNQFPTAKSPTGPAPSAAQHLAVPPALSQQSSLKYQAAPPPPPPTTYPPPIEAYPSPKINPNFLTPKFDRTSLPRSNNFPSPSPVKFEISSTASKSVMPMMATAGSTAKPTTPITSATAGHGATTPMMTSIAAAATTTTTSTLVAATGAAAAGASAATTSSAAAAGAAASADPLKDEIGSILAANLMPSKEESGKIFGIASVSLAQSSGPDNTKCTLGKCGSIHKPVLGPVVPTEGYIGDQLSSKERRKAKVNMTHEQIQKWLMECSSNPDEIQDDLDDDNDDNLRPNIYATTPPPTRDDKESTSFSSSSKATRDLGKSESAWSAKGPSLKAVPVVATTNRKDDSGKMDVGCAPIEVTPEPATTATHKTSVKQQSSIANDEKIRLDRKQEKKFRDKSAASKELTVKESKANKSEKETANAHSSKQPPLSGKHSTSGAVTEQNPTASEVISTPKQNKKKTTATTASPTTSTPTTARKNSPATVTSSAAAASGTAKTPKRTPVYSQKIQKQIELKETTTTSHKRTAPFSYGGAFSADNEKSIYSFDKDDDEGAAKGAGTGGAGVADGSGGAAPKSSISKPAFRKQGGGAGRRDSNFEDAIGNSITPTTKTSVTKRAAAAAAEKANKDIANASQSSSVSLTLSPSENCKLVKVSLDAEKTVGNTRHQQAAAVAAASAGGKTPTTAATKSNKKTDPAIANDADSDSDGHTYYIPLQSSGVGGEAEGGIQGVAVKLGREGPEGPNQKVIMHATLVTKSQMGSNSKPLPDSMNVSDIVKTLMTSGSAATASNEASKKTTKSNAVASTSAAAAAAAAASAATSATAANSASSSLKNVPIGTVQPRFKASDPTTSAAAAASTSAGLVRVNSNSSLFSGSAKSRIGAQGGAGGGVGGVGSSVNKKFKDDTPIKMSNNTAFPRHDDPTQMVEAPIFRPTDKEFSDPIEFIERITPIAARFGICKIIPPATFKPECRISDEMRFTAYNQYVHKMLHRWGPSAKELSAIKKYLATQSIVMNHPPWIGGMEVDLPRLYHTVQELGGLKEVIEKKKWARVAEEMCIPKLAQDRVTKLDDIYCKYLLPYDTLSPAERQKLFDEVEADWAKREARARRNADRFVNTESVSNEEDDMSSEEDEESEEEVDGVSMECIIKGRSMPLSQFYRIARNTMALWFKNTEPTVNEVEAEFWRHVAVRDSHVCVHSGSIDSSGWGYGFPSPGPKGKGSNYARHPWNLKVLTNNPGSVLRSLGPVMGVTVPTLHVGMLFSACCWYRDPHGLSWIEYLHTGASKLWYGIPDDQSANFRAALTSLIPTHCQNKTIWLPCDTVMVPPHMLTDRGVSLCRIEQKPGEFIVVFPRAYTSSLATGYVVSESVYFATASWLDLAKDDFRDIHDSCEPAMFSLEQLLFALGYDQRVTPDALQQMQPMLHEVFEKEMAAREQLKAAGVTSTEKVHNEKGGSKAKKQQQPPFKSIESECDLCRANLYISMVKTEEGNIYCLQHALKNLNNGNIQAKQCKLIYAYNIEDIENLIKSLKEKIQQKRNTTVSKKMK